MSQLSTENPDVPSENLVQVKWDKCLAETIVIGGYGLGTGILASVLLFRRKIFPIPLCLGFSLGISTEKCRQRFSLENNFQLIPLPTKKE